MENFNLSLLSAPVAVKKVSSDVRGLPSKQSEREFSGVLTQEKDSVDNVQESFTVKSDERKESPVEHTPDEPQKAGSNAGHQTVKNELSGKTTENGDDDIQETWVNVFAVVPVEDVVQDNLEKVQQFAELAGNLEIQTLFTEMPEEGTLMTSQIEIPDVAAFGDEIIALNEESLEEQNNLLSNDSGEFLLPGLSVDNELGSGGLRFQEESAAAESDVESTAEKVVGKVTEKLSTSGLKVEFAAVESEKKKIESVKNQKVEIPKIDAVQNVLQDNLAAAVTEDPIVANSEKDGLHQARQIDRLSSQGGISLDELPDEVEVYVKSEIVASDEKLQHKVNISDRLSDNRFPSGSEVGTVHLQGRARENQPSLMQNGQGQTDSRTFAEGENSHGKAVFLDELKSSVSEKTTAESISLSGSKDNKPGLDTNFAKSVFLTDANSDLGSVAVVKKGAGTMLSKPLPISDEHLLNQIQAGLTRQVNGRQTVTIKLWPEHLGRVDVKLVMHKQHLTATFMVDHPDVKDAMMRKVESLRDSLGLRGIDAKDVSIKVAPAKSGDGPSLMADSQQHDGNSAWRQFNQGNSGNDSSGAKFGWNGNLDDDQLSAGTEIIDGISSMAENITDTGSLHITA